MAKEKIKPNKVTNHASESNDLGHEINMPVGVNKRGNQKQRKK